MPAAAGIGVLGLVLVVAGGLFDAEALYVPGVALAALGAALPAWVRAAADGAGVSRMLDTRRVEEEAPLGVVLEATPGRLPPLSATVEDPLLRRAVPVTLGAGPARVRLSVRFARRGRRHLEPPRLMLGDPLGLTLRAVGGADDDEVLVLPRTTPVRALRDGDAERAGPSAVLLAAFAASEVDGLRPYREGAPAARIHWPAVARGAGLVERRMRPDGDARPLVVLDPRGAASTEDLDAAVRATASLALALARAGGCALLLPGERRATALDGDLGAWPAAHARLALVEDSPTSGPPPVGDARRGALFLVAAAGRSELPPAMQAAARGARMLVVPRPIAGRVPVFEVAGCHGYELAARRARVPVAG